MSESVYKVIELIGTSATIRGRRRPPPPLSARAKACGNFASQKSCNSIS